MWSKVLIFLCLFLIHCTKSHLLASEAKNFDAQISSLIQNGSVVLAELDGTILYEYNSQEKFIPASILKIAISQAALDTLGGNYRFSTSLYMDSERNLLIRGGGDPNLISEEIAIIARELKKKSYFSFQKLYLDDSLTETKRVPGSGQSLNAYDALNGALIVNYNTLYLRRDEAGNIFSAEEQTPLTKLARTKGKLLKKGTKERISLSTNYEESLQYVAELFQEIFRKEGIKIQKEGYQKTKVGSKWREILKHSNSRKLLPQILEGLLLYSNNYTANQIYLQIGGKLEDEPYNLSKSNQVFQTYLEKNIGLKKQDFNIVEGSGLSKENRINGLSMIKILQKFKNYSYLLPKDYSAYIKTGTLKGVYNLAGYIPYQNKMYPFCIIINASQNNRTKVLKLLQLWIKNKK